MRRNGEGEECEEQGEKEKNVRSKVNDVAGPAEGTGSGGCGCGYGREFMTLMEYQWLKEK